MRMKRYIDDMIEEIAKETGNSWDDAMDVFNKMNEEGEIRSWEDLRRHLKEIR